MTVKIKLPSLFSDHAVLQHGKPIPVWGWTDPDTKVRVTLGSANAETRSAADGRFLLRLPPFAPGGPYTLAVQAGKASAVVKDVMVGEVWVASGQSNMEWTVSNCGKQGAETLAKSADSQVRMFNVARTTRYGRQADVGGVWQIAGRETLGQFSAVGFHFADKIQKTLKIPVGILHASWGGTIVEAWTSREALMESPVTRAWTERYEGCVHLPGQAIMDPAAFRAQNFPADPGTKRPAAWAGADCDDSDWATTELPRHWQADGHDFSGVFWFRLHLDLPASWKGKALELRLGGIDKMDITYFNGSKVGATGKGLEETHWNVLRRYTVPGRLVRAGRNVIAVRAFSFVHGGGMIGPAEAMSVAPADGSGAPMSLAGTWRFAIEHNLGKTLLPGSQALPMGPENPNSPYMLYDNMIYPLIPYAIGGAIWYQGESNTDNTANYRGMMVNLICDWRRAWGQGNFPFLMVQLANYMEASPYQEGSTWARLREAQSQALAEPATGMAVAIDVGDAKDIHPHDKRSVGERLAQWALVEHFGRPGAASGPLYAGMTIEGSRIRIRFDHVGGGLVAKGQRTVSHVMIAGLGRRFMPAKAVIEGSTLVVESPEVEFPVAVRYAWADNPEGCNLYNRGGLPASPFRTDNW